jgi:hypothetical protein
MFKYQSNLSFRQLLCLFWSIFWRSFLLLIAGIFVVYLIIAGIREFMVEDINHPVFNNFIKTIIYASIFSISVTASIIGFINGLKKTRKDYSIQAITLTGIKALSELSLIEKISLWWSYQWRTMFFVLLINIFSNVLLAIFNNLGLSFVFNNIYPFVSFLLHLFIQIVCLDRVLALKQKTFSLIISKLRK